MKIYDVKWSATTAGPSPYNNERTELFLFGCKRACEGNPCKGCFNPKLWDSSSTTRTYTPKEVAETIIKHSPNKYITIGGGEPTDQFEELIELCRILHDSGYHILVYTWKDLASILYNKKHNEYKLFKELMKHCNIIVDGEYDEDQRKYNESAKDGFTSSIGSGNQRVWSISNNNAIGYRMKHINGLRLGEDDVLQYNLRDDIVVTPKNVLL